jgi:putative hydrolase of the HAD superfamily
VNRPIDLFIFDEGGVMIQNFYVIPSMAAKMGIEEKELIALLKPDLAGMSAGRLGGAEFWKRFADRTGIEVPEDYFATLFDPAPTPGSFELVADLAREHRVVCGTNTIESHHSINMERGFYRGFHAVYASHLMGRVKPEPAFWTDILAAEGRSPESAFFVDDSPANVEAARALGIMAELFQGVESLRRVLEDLGALGTDTRTST